MTPTAPSAARGHVPGMGHPRLIGLYDGVQWLLGVPSAHAAMVDRAGIGSGQRVLEIGCGTGNLAIRVKRRRPSTTVVGLDPDRPALARARRKAERGALEVQFDHGFAERLPYPDASFDVVLSAFMFHHLRADERLDALREVGRVLRPGGSLHLLDVGGTTGDSSRLLTRLARHSPRLLDHFDGRIPTLMREAGLAAPTELSRKVSRVLGVITHYRAIAPPAGGAVPSA